ncbi:cell division GTPase FtsZ [Flavobacterium sp. 7E]|uniref:hypothetical protein n=1 Tax=Flavobacterium sp. 7E TaxID=2735898 RepID=UPI00156E84CB|nr:hypothetical protein [Flavobacterium sp. 7E]NRS87457.1 cell division GTPase FtsZ [Flavobacterium sp. 7E]
MSKNNQQTKNELSASMILEIDLKSNYEEYLINVHHSFIKELLNNGKLLAKTKTAIENPEQALIGIAITSGNARATKAIELALLPLLREEVLERTNKNIFLQIPSYSTELSIDEVGIINDYIQEKSGYDAHIVMMVSEDENLGNATAISIVTSKNLKFR